MSEPIENAQRSSTIDQRRFWEKAYLQEHPLWRGPSDLELDNLRGRVLEIGCGDGKTAMAIIEKGLSVVGLDASRAALSTSSRRIYSDRLCLVQGNAIELPFKSKSFDSVTMVHFIDHLLATGRERAAKEIDRVLRPGGTIIGRFFSVDDIRCGKGKQIEPNTYLRGNGISVHYFIDEEILELFEGYLVEKMCESKKRTKFSQDGGHRSFMTVELRK